MSHTVNDEFAIRIFRNLGMRDSGYRLLNGYYEVSVERVYYNVEENSIDWTFQITSEEHTGTNVIHFYSLNEEKERDEAFGILELCGLDPERGKFLNNESSQKQLKGIRLKLFIADKVFKVCKRIK